jgi:hypothetical protein
MKSRVSAWVASGLGRGSRFRFGAAGAMGSLALGCGSSEIHGGAAFEDGEAEVAGEGGERASAPLDFGLSDSELDDVEVVCAARAAASELRRVSLAFVFDVSGSMGGNDRNRFETKWQPVVAASEAFFASTDAAALSASLTFFPKQSTDTRCRPRAYEVPEVAEQALPSAAFAGAIRDLGYTLGSSNWRSTTPTLAAFTGVSAAVRAAADGTSTARAIVMVTDGVPQGCDGADDVELVAQAVRGAAIQTFVVGVANPPGDGDGDNLANLNVIAEAGGTGQAFIVATGDAAQTEVEFRSVINGIRGIALSCNVEIPVPPSGSAFLPDQVNVAYTSGPGSPTSLSYDPACSGPDTWRYDNVLAPATIVLCNETCDRVQRDVSARLTVEFGCERRGSPR